MMRERRQVGFIKTFSSKQISYHHDEPSEFSYFKIKGARDDDQFSPYKLSNQHNQHKSPQETLAKPFIPKPKVVNQPILKPKVPNPPKKYHTQKVIPQKIMQNNSQEEEGKNILQKVQQNNFFLKETQKNSKQKLQKNMGNIKSKIDELDQQLKRLKLSKQKKRRQSQQKFRLTNINKSKSKYRIESSQKSSSSSSQQNQEQNVKKSIDSPITHKPMNNSNSNQYRYNYHIDFDSTKKPPSSLKTIGQNKMENPKVLYSQNFITFNSRATNKPPMVIKSYSSQSQEEEVEEKQPYYLQQKKSSRQQQQRAVPVQKEIEFSNVNSKVQMYRNKGGVCFDIDVKQFTEPIIKPKQDRPAKQPKPQKVDKKADILKRREQAKLYDKIARKNVFHPYK